MKTSPFPIGLMIVLTISAAQAQITVTSTIGDNDGYGLGIADWAPLPDYLPKPVVSVPFDIDADGLDETLVGLRMEPDFVTLNNVFVFPDVGPHVHGGVLIADFAALVAPPEFLGEAVNSIALVDNDGAGTLDLTGAFFPIVQDNLETGLVSAHVDPTFLADALSDGVVGLSATITDTDDVRFAVDFFSLTAFTVPAVSTWGMIVIAVLLLIGITIKFGRHRRVANG
ncbi:MAG: hypothetical protein JSU63_13685 [Phycisphaerales bacterium]|nr:MAG: hypothetical protein JSU63_13685 [Phycisphaerales bacterium]